MKKLSAIQKITIKDGAQINIDNDGKIEIKNVHQILQDKNKILFIGKEQHLCNQNNYLWLFSCDIFSRKQLIDTSNGDVLFLVQSLIEEIHVLNSSSLVIDSDFINPTKLNVKIVNDSSLNISDNIGITRGTLNINVSGTGKFNTNSKWNYINSVCADYSLIDFGVLLGKGFFNVKNHSKIMGERDKITSSIGSMDRDKHSSIDLRHSSTIAQEFNHLMIYDLMKR